MAEENFTEFLNDYLYLFASRSTSASIRFETDTDAEKAENALMFEGNLKAIKYLFRLGEDILRPDIIQEIARKVDYESNSKGFRTVNIEVGGSNVKRSDTKQIYPHIYSLLDNYYNVWSAIEDPYLKEAYFHINFLHIHPFEDGNGRVARIMTAYNLYKSGEVCFVITKEDKENYNQCIEQSNYVGMADLFKKLAKEEKLVIDQLYEKYSLEKHRGRK